MARKVLIIAFHFPPIQGSSGFLRTLKFAKYLPGFGVEPTILTVAPRVYDATDGKMLSQVPPGVEVHRSFALDTKKHLGLRGRYPGFLCIPDRYISWIPMGVWDGIRLMRRKGIDAVFSTYPIPSAHVIANLVSKYARRPWIADFRDPMWDPYIPFESEAEKNARMAIEKNAVARASRVVVVTPSMETLFRARYPGLPAGKIQVIPNGYDEADFARFDLPQGIPAPRPPGPITLLHAGLLEREDRNPTGLFQALVDLRRRGKLPPEGLRVRLIASGHEAEYARELRDLDLGDLVSLESNLPYAQALDAMAASDILLLFQGPSCDTQIPAKVYEYLRIGKPILALATEAGETGRLVAATGSGKVVRIDDAAAIAACLEGWTREIRAGNRIETATPEVVAGFSRQSQAKQLADLILGL